MSGDGYLTWDSRYLSGYPQLDGAGWTANGIPLDMQWEEIDEGSEIVSIAVASGENVLQSSIADDAASDNPSLWRFDLPVQAIDETVHRKLLMAKRKGAAVQFIPHIWEMEHFAGLQVADTRSLSRPVAWTLVSGVTSVTHPAVFYKNGVVDTDCASLGGTLSQTLTVAEAGDIAVWYMPVFYVIVRKVSSAFQGVNGLMVDVTLEEIRRYA